MSIGRGAGVHGEHKSLGNEHVEEGSVGKANPRGMGISGEAGVNEKCVSLGNEHQCRSRGQWGMNISRGAGLSGECRSLGNGYQWRNGVS